MNKVTSKWQVGDIVVSLIAPSETWKVIEINDDETKATLECTTRKNTVSGIIHYLCLGGFVAYRQ